MFWFCLKATKLHNNFLHYNIITFAAKCPIVQIVTCAIGICYDMYYRIVAYPNQNSSVFVAIKLLLLKRVICYFVINNFHLKHQLNCR